MNNEPFRILLADDDEADCLIFKEAFEELEIISHVQVVSSGLELMELLGKNDVPLPHFLFLDLNMPVKNGLTCLKEIRGNKLLHDMFIAIYSTSSSEQDVVETFRNGANVYIQKPNDFETLKLILEKAVMTADTYREPPFNKDNFLLRL
jgi:CheY-like chemotaxis protein